MRAILFEDLGGRDENAESAYLAGVDEAQFYIGIVGDRYGTMQASGRSPTHDEYRRARNLGRRVSVWVEADGSQRQGDARDFVDEVRVFHTTGSFSTADDLAERVKRRMAEIAAEEDSPWVKIGDVVVRAERIEDAGDRLAVTTTASDIRVARGLEDLRADGWGRSREVPVTTATRSGKLTIESVVSESESRSLTKLAIVGAVLWEPTGGHSGAMSMGGHSSDDLTELGLRSVLFGEPLPADLTNAFAFTGQNLDEDPLDEVNLEALPPATAEAVAQLLLVEYLVGGRRASSVDAFELGPVHRGRRRLRLGYTEPQHYSNEAPRQREAEGLLGK